MRCSHLFDKYADDHCSYQDLQNRLFTIFQFVFVARTSVHTVLYIQLNECIAGVIAQTQPKFIANRDVFESKSAVVYEPLR